MTTPPAPPLSQAMLLLAAGRLVERRLEGELATDGLSLRFTGVLGHLLRSPGLSYSELARRSDVSVQAMHVCVGKLVARGLVRSEGHARGASGELRVTAAGEQAVDLFRAHLAALDEELAGVEVADLAGVVRLLAGPG